MQIQCEILVYMYMFVYSLSIEVLHMKYKAGFLKWQLAKDERRGIGKEPSMPPIIA